MCQTLYWVQKANGVENIKTCGPHSHLEHLDSLVSAYEELNRHKGFHRLQLNCIFATLSSPDDLWSAKIEEQEHEKEGVRNYVPYSTSLSICNTPLMPKCAKVGNCNNTKNPPFPGFAALAKCSHPDVKQPQQMIFSLFFSLLWPHFETKPLAWWHQHSCFEMRVMKIKTRREWKMLQDCHCYWQQSTNKSWWGKPKK